MELGLKGKVALVTAASKGLGKACALGFAREGASVAVCSRDEAAVQATAEEILRRRGAIRCADIRSPGPRVDRQAQAEISRVLEFVGLA